MKIGDRVLVKGIVDEIRKDVVIIKNNGGYFGTVPSEIIDKYAEQEPKPMMRTEEVKRAIDYLLGIWGDYGRHERAVEVLIAYIENLENEVPKEPCEDAVSRQAVLDAIKRISLGQTDAVKVSMMTEEYVKQLPNV